MMEDVFFNIFITLCVLFPLNNIQANVLEYRSMPFKPSPNYKGNAMSSSHKDDYCIKNHQSCLQHNVYYEQVKQLNARKSGAVSQRVCAYNSETGLQNFDSPCDVALKNCEIRRPMVMRNAFAKLSKAKGIFYYNGQIKPCLYYLKRTKTRNEAVSLYYADTLNLEKYANGQ